MKGTWRQSTYNGDSESYIRHVKKSFGNGASNLQTGSIRETWKEGPYTEDSKKLVMEGSGNIASLL